MPTKKKLKPDPVLLERHAFWRGDATTADALIERLAMRHGVTSRVAPMFGWFLKDGPTSQPLGKRWADLAISLAGVLYPAFEKLPNKGGRHPRRFGGIFDPYPYADAARLVQLFDAIKKKLKQRGEPARVEDVCVILHLKYSKPGKYQKWRYNEMKVSTLKRAWEGISVEVKAHPERFLPLDESELFSLGRQLPPLPQRSKARG
jgi:hypothetical protein